jgi:hypothetical protein
MDGLVLDAQRVAAIFEDCLFRGGDSTTGSIEADGITWRVYFHPGRLEGYREEIAALLDELPDDFKSSGGGGASFLAACQDKHGRQWGEHPTMQLLLLLGLATGKVEYCAPRKLWSAFPGGMPYIVIK